MPLSLLDIEGFMTFLGNNMTFKGIDFIWVLQWEISVGKHLRQISQIFKDSRYPFDVMVLLRLQRLSLGWKCLISTRLSQFKRTFLNILNCSFLKFQVLSVHSTAKSTYFKLQIVITKMDTTFRHLFRHTHLLKLFAFKKEATLLHSFIRSINFSN